VLLFIFKQVDDLFWKTVQSNRYECLPEKAVFKYMHLAFILSTSILVYSKSMSYAVLNYSLTHTHTRIHV
jgi:hypothetical protein